MSAKLCGCQKSTNKINNDRNGYGNLVLIYFHGELTCVRGRYCSSSWILCTIKTSIARRVIGIMLVFVCYG